MRVAWLRLLRCSFLFPLAACSTSSTATTPADAGGQDSGATDGASPENDAATGADAAETGAGPSTSPWTSGTRLRAVVETAGSAKRFESWHDTSLDVDCAFGVADDGQRRCLPHVDAETLYDDINCKQLVGSFVTGKTPKYLPPPNAALVCGTGGSFYAVGAEYTPTALFYFDGTGCSSTSLVAGRTYVHAGASVPASTFVASTETSEPRGSRLRARQLVTSDGSRLDVGLFDDGRSGARCGAVTSDKGATYCVPEIVAYLEGQYSDGSCANPLGAYFRTVQDLCSLQPSAILDSRNVAAAQSLSIFELGAKSTGALFEGMPGACNTKTPSASIDYFAIGAAVPLSTLPLMPKAPEGTGRIQLSIARTESGALGSVLGFYDSTLNVACMKGVAADGMTRCLPYSTVPISHFSDGGCTQALYSLAAGDTPPPADTIVEGPGPSPGSSAFFRLGAKTTVPAQWFAWISGTCAGETPSATQDYYATTAIDASTLVTVTTAVE